MSYLLFGCLCLLPTTISVVLATSRPDRREWRKRLFPVLIAAWIFWLGLVVGSASHTHRFFAALQAGDLDAVKAMIAKEPSLLESRTLLGEGVLHLAVRSGKVAMVASLIKGPVDLNLQDMDGMTPLHLAVSRGDVAIARVLADAGADVSLPCDRFHGRPLHTAAALDDAAMIEMLLAHGADPTAVDDQGKTPATLAFERGKLDAVTALAAQPKPRAQNPAISNSTEATDVIVVVQNATIGDGSKYHWQEADVVRVMTNTTDVDLGARISFAHLFSEPDVPSGSTEIRLQRMSGPPPWWRVVRGEPVKIPDQ